MIGQMLAHYEIVGSLGKGGMGEVWRARDTRLEREVAIKTLPTAFAQDAERLARFEREAKLLAALNHPHIAAVYGLDEHEGTRFLVMELIEGQTLDLRLQQGALPIDDALILARQIAEALEAAHDKGVVHRDLKPANVMITREGNVKVLDFGLAKAFTGNPIEASPAHSPALSLAMTQAGIILGTAGYMSPEQASGQATDQRADVWSFGVVVYEMLSGQPVFTGESVPHILAGILRTDPNWTLLPKALHPRVRLMLERCLTKRPRDRYHSIADARVDIDAALADPGGAIAAQAPATHSAARSVLPWVAGILLAVLAGGAAWISKPSPAPAPALVARFAQVLAPDQIFRNMGRDVVAVSPDGRQIVYNTSTGLMLRVLEEVEPRIIPGTEGAITSPFFSPDGEWIGYFDRGRGELRKVRISGGTSVLIAAASNPMGASWAADGTIVFGQPDGIMRVSGDGGPVEVFTSANASEEQLWDPQVLPNGAVLFTRWRSANDGMITVAGSGAAERTELFPGERAIYVPTGHLVVSDPRTSPNTLLARTFDPASLDFGGAVPIEERVAMFQNKTHFAVSPAGSLVYIFGESTGDTQRPQRTLTWVDRTGEETPLALPPNDYTMARISPDGTKVALVIGSVLPVSDPPPDIWILDLETDTFRQLTFNAETDDMPVWSRDSERIYYRSFRDATPAIYSIPWDGGDGQAMLVGTSDDFGFPSPWSISPDEGVIAFNFGATVENINLGTLSLTGDAVFTTLLAEPGMETEPVIAPNGRWLAYQLNLPQSAPEINVRPFPGVAPQRIPVVQGAGPVFSPDGTELFYFDGNGISVFDVGYEPGFFRRNGRSLFRRSYQYGSSGPDGFGGRAWDLHPNAQQFLMINLPGVNGEQGAEASRLRIHIVVNWFQDLEARALRP